MEASPPIALRRTPHRSAEGFSPRRLGLVAGQDLAESLRARCS